MDKPDCVRLTIDLTGKPIEEFENFMELATDMFRWCIQEYNRNPDVWIVTNEQICYMQKYMKDHFDVFNCTYEERQKMPFMKKELMGIPVEVSE